MRDFFAFLQMCASSGTLIASLCGLLFVPLAAWLAIRTIAPMVRSMNGDPAWQAPLASVSGTLPGFVFFTIGTVGLLGAASSGCLAFVWGRVLFASILLLLLAATGRATVRALGRQCEIDRLLAESFEPPEDVRRISLAVGVRVRVANSALPLCATTGVRRPLVLLSTASLARLKAAELEAALRHERAHASRGDVLLATLLSFFVDLLPLPADDLIATYHRAREFAADAHAVHRADPQHLAGAIVALAGSRRITAAAPALAEDAATLKARIRAVFEPRAAASRLHRGIALLSLGLVATASLAPAAITALNFYHCTAPGMPPT